MSPQDINKERLNLLHPDPATLIRFGLPENGPQVNALKHLETLTPDERTVLLGEMYELYEVAMRKNLSDLQRMAG